MKRALIQAMLVAFLIAGAAPGCGGGGENPAPPPDDDVLINDLDGAADVAVDSAFKYDFAQAIDATTVTNQSFFMVDAGEVDADLSKRAFDPALCDNAQAIAAIVSCLTTTTCQLDPAENLGTYRRYLVCLGTDILYSNGNPFEGFMAAFTTAGTPPTYTVGGAVTGLVGTGLVLQDNGGDDLAVSADGAFQFATALANRASYAVTVKTQPASPTQTCTVNSGSGTVTNSNVTDVSVICSTNSYNVGGTVSGLDGAGLVLQDNGGDDLDIAADGAFTFATKVASGAGYAVTVKTQPTGLSQTCAVTGGSGTMGSADVADVSVVCTTNTFTIGGTVSGLDGTVVLQDNGGDDLTISANGAFTFTTKIDDGGDYAVTVKTQPSTQLCEVTNGTGTVVAANITNVGVTCSYEPVIFRTATAYTGGLGGIAGADAKCGSDGNKPDSRTYKAMICDESNRRACSTDDCSGGPSEHIDWVLNASTSYYRPGLAVKIGTTTANGIFAFPLDAGFTAESSLVWTGLRATWRTTNDCNDWTDGSAGSEGHYGQSDSTTITAIQYSTTQCSAPLTYLICVSQ